MSTVPPINFLVIQPGLTIPYAEVNGKKYMLLKNDGLCFLLAGPVPSDFELKKEGIIHIDGSSSQERRLWQCAIIPEGYKFDIKYGKIGPFTFRKWWIPPCTNNCHNNLKRWHTTCLWKCKFYLIVQGKAPQMWPVDVFMFYRREDRKGAHWKNACMKRLWQIMEIFAVWRGRTSIGV